MTLSNNADRLVVLRAVGRTENPGEASSKGVGIIIGLTDMPKSGWVVVVGGGTPAPTALGGAAKQSTYFSI